MTKEQLLLLESFTKETPISILEKINLLTFRKKWGGIVASPKLTISLTSGISRSVELISIHFSGNSSSAVFWDNTTEGIFFVSTQKIESVLIENFNTISPFYPFKTNETTIPYYGKLDLQRNLEKLKKSFNEIFSKEILFNHNYEEEKNVNISCFMLIECFSLIIEKLNSMALNDKLSKESIIEKIDSISIDKKENFAINLSNKNLNIFIDYENADELKELFPDSLEKKLESIL